MEKLTEDVHSIRIESSDNLYPAPIVGLPVELLEAILMRSDSKTLLAVSEVCLAWQNIIESKQFWKKKLNWLGFNLPKEVLQNDNLEWHFFFSLSLNPHLNPYETNVLSNGSGELESDIKLETGNRNEEDFDEDWFQYWNILSSGGQGWRLFPGSGEPNQTKRFFATSNFSCTKEQWVSLMEKGFDPNILDTYQPSIEIEEFYSKSEHHGASYEVQVCLLDGCGNVVDNPFSFRENMNADDSEGWRRVSHSFKDYGVGVRYIKFYHGGMAEDMEDGWHGSKMTGASVRLRYPDRTKTNKIFICKCKSKHKIPQNLT